VSDEPYSPFGGRRSEPRKLILIERVWRVRHPRSVKILSCGTYQHPHGIEVRSGYQQETKLLWSQLVGHHHDEKALRTSAQFTTETGQWNAGR